MALLSELHKAHDEVCLVFNDTDQFDPRPSHHAVQTNGEIARTIAEKLARQFAKQLIALGAMGTIDPSTIDDSDENLLFDDIMFGFDERFSQRFEDAEERAAEEARERRRVAA